MQQNPDNSPTAIHPRGTNNRVALLDNSSVMNTSDDEDINILRKRNLSYREPTQQKKIKTASGNVEEHWERSQEFVAHQSAGSSNSSIHHPSSSNNGLENEVSAGLMARAWPPTEAQSSTSEVNIERPTESKKFLFEKILSSSDVGDYNRLLIPKKLAEEHFPSIKISKNEYKKGQIRFIDKDNRMWEMNFGYWKKSQSYVLTRGWKAFVKHHGIHSRDVIRIYDFNVQEQQQQPEEHIKYYGIEHVHGRSRGRKLIRLFGKDVYVDDNNGLRSNGGRRRIRKMQTQARK